MVVEDKRSHQVLVVNFNFNFNIWYEFGMLMQYPFQLGEEISFDAHLR